MAAAQIDQLELEIKRLKLELASVRRTKDAKTAELLKSEERFALAMRTANDGLWDWDLRTNVVYYSPRWKGMLGYQEGELGNTLDTWKTLVHPDERESVLQHANDYLTGISSAFEVEMRMKHKDGRYLFIRSRAFAVRSDETGEPIRLIGTHVDISVRKKTEIFDKQYSIIIEMIAKGHPAAHIYDQIALLYEAKHPGLRCSMLVLEGSVLLHGGAPSLPEAYCKAVNGLVNGPNVGSCGTSTYTGKQVLVEDIATDPKWAELKDVALPFGMRSCWSEPIKSSTGKVLGAFGMYYNHPCLPNNVEQTDLVAAARLAGIVMERERNLKRISDLAFKDELTGLNSRAQFYLTVEKMIKEARRSCSQFGLLYIDLDNFKDVNDSLGHDVGDLLLQECALRFGSACRESDFLARLSGDEFCILIKDVKDQCDLSIMINRCLTAVSAPIELEGRKIIPTCSIGAAVFPVDADNQQALLKSADTALYEAKAKGKNCFAYYDRSLTEKAEYRFKVEHLLREAVEAKQLNLVYQPQIDIKTGRIIGVEVLSRWYCPVLGQVSPDEFIAIAERIGLIAQLTRWVMETASDQIKKWKQDMELDHDFHVAVNISPTHFLDDDLLSLVDSVIDDENIKASHLELEVTEGVVQTSQYNLSVFDRLERLGVTVAIDDFGTGYSSFASLKHLNIDHLKIDKSFIDDIASDEKTMLLVGSMISMAHSLGYKVTAEGVEQSEQFDCLRALGCDRVQGYLFSKPVTADKMLDMFREQPFLEG